MQGDLRKKTLDFDTVRIGFHRPPGRQQSQMPAAGKVPGDFGGWPQDTKDPEGGPLWSKFGLPLLQIVLLDGS